MKAPDFDYQRPASLKDAIALLSDHDGDAQALAGGQSLMPMMNFRVAAPSALIDLADIEELKGVSRDGDDIRIGAMTRYCDLESNADLLEAVPLLAMALPHIAHAAIRNRGTIGGSLALADPAAEMPALMLALGAEIEVAGPDGTRRIGIDDFLQGYYETALEEAELIVAIHLRAASADQKFGFYELTQRHGDYALAGVAIAAAGPKHRIAFFGVSDRALRPSALEAALEGAPDDDAVAAALHHLDDITIEGDVKASAAMRQRFAGVVLRRAFKEMYQ